MEKYYITTAIPYANAEPHVGHVLELIGTDVMARAKRLIGYEVYFQTGTDEHGQKMLEYAERAGKSPQEYADEIAPRFQQLWEEFTISHDYFIRSTDQRHKDGVVSFWRTVRDNGDIYLSKYEGWYCVPDETFVLENQVKEGAEGQKLCPECGRELTWNSEESYFFRWSKYQDAVLKYITDNPQFIAPSFRANEMINSFLKPGLQDLSISRTSMKWGVPVPDDPRHVIYVWFDALINYITGVGFGWDEGPFSKWWPADVHVVGKDILKFHTLLWPAMCMSAGIALPRRVFGHGFVSPRAEAGGKVQLAETITYKVQDVETKKGNESVTVDVFDLNESLGTVTVKGYNTDNIEAAIADQFGPRVQKLEKMSKSKGNVVRPRDLLAIFGGNPDPIRYFLMRELDFGQDGLFSEEALKGRYDSDLAKGLGNLLARTLNMVEKYQNGLVEVPAAYTEEEDAVRDTIMSLFQRADLPEDSVVVDSTGIRTLYEQLIDDCKFNFLLQRVWAIISRMDVFISHTQPWALAKNLENKSRVSAILYVLCEGIRVIATYLYPFMPATSLRIWEQLGVTVPLEKAPFDKLRRWGFISETKVVRGENLFPRLD